VKYPKRSDIPLPAGYRWIDVGEELKHGDIYFDSYTKKEWEPCLMNCQMMNPEGMFARKIEEQRPEKEWLNTWD